MPLSVLVSVSFSNTTCLRILVIILSQLLSNLIFVCLSNLTLFKGIHVLMIWEIVLSRMSSIYSVYNSVLTCRQHIINSSVTASPNATKIAVKKVSDVDVCLFGPEL